MYFKRKKFGLRSEGVWKMLHLLRSPLSLAHEYSWPTVLKLNKHFCSSWHLQKGLFTLFTAGNTCSLILNIFGNKSYQFYCSLMCCFTHNQLEMDETTGLYSTNFWSSTGFQPWILDFQFCFISETTFWADQYSDGPADQWCLKGSVCVCVWVTPDKLEGVLLVTLSLAKIVNVMNFLGIISSCYIII